MNSLRHNVFANYLSQIYVSGVGILSLPFLITTMGAEAYGLIGFFSMLQAWFMLLDLGLTPTISRETARFRGGGLSNIEYRQLFRSLSVIFIAIAVLGGGSFFYLSEFISSSWLQVNMLGLRDVSFAVQVMSISIALRWLAGLYRGVITGSESLVWLSGVASIISTFRFLLVFPVLWFFGSDIKTFFSYQLVVALFEFVILFVKSRELIPTLTAIERSQIGWSFAPVKQVLRFSLSIAFTSGLWVVVTQTDKLIMSNLLSLESYGYFTLAILLASGITMLTSPIANAIMPRLARLESEGKHSEFIQVYRSATRLLTSVIGAVAIIMIFFAEPIVMVWTGDVAIVKIVAPILTIYALGYGFLSVSAFPYYLQYAKGNLTLHIFGSIFFVSIILPALYFFTKHYGMIGAGYAWLLVNIVYFLCWPYIVHNRYFRGLHFSWLTKDIFYIVLPPALFAFVSQNWVVVDSRMLTFVKLTLISFVILCISFLGNKEGRNIIISQASKFRVSFL